MSKDVEFQDVVYTVNLTTNLGNNNFEINKKREIIPQSTIFFFSPFSTQSTKRRKNACYKE